MVIRTCPNLGRDLGPFLTEFRDVLGEYDIVGHVHSKRSEALGSDSGDLWREFLWQHLIGDAVPAMDAAFAAFEQDDDLGLIYPADPHLSDWDGNREHAERLIARMGLDTALPAFFNFPIGTMFWARPRALQPLLDLKLDWSDYPGEPLPYDGTMLHALERLIGLVPLGRGFTDAVMHLPGINPIGLGAFGEQGTRRYGSQHPPRSTISMSWRPPLPAGKMRMRRLFSMSTGIARSVIRRRGSSPSIRGCGTISSASGVGRSRASAR